MKKLALLLFILSANAYVAQKSTSCFLEYYDLFNTRKANKVPDGVQNVVVTVRDTKANTCQTMVGTIVVKDHKISGALKLKNTRGEYVKPKEKLNAKYEEPKTNLKADYSIVNGMSANFLTNDMKVVNVFFMDYLKKPEPSLVEAPEIKKH